MNRSPVRWVGGKFFLLPHILPRIPPHQVYVEVFGGAAHVLFAKKPSRIEVYNDLDDRLYNLFKVMRDPTMAQKLIAQVSLTPYARQEYEYAWYYLRNIPPSEKDPVEFARCFLVLIYQSFNGKVSHRCGWCYGVNSDTSPKYAPWNTLPDRLKEALIRLKNVYIEHDDFREIVKRYDSKDTFFYLDPPYVPETLGSKYYACDLSTQDHQELTELLLSIKGSAMLSGYEHPVYQPLLDNGWSLYKIPRKVVSYDSKTNKQNTLDVTECLYLSPSINPYPDQLPLEYPSKNP